MLKFYGAGTMVKAATVRANSSKLFGQKASQAAVTQQKVRQVLIVSNHLL